LLSRPPTENWRWSPAVLGAVALTTLSILPWSAGLIYAIGGPNVEKSEAMKSLMEVFRGGNPLATIFALTIVAPFAEEIFFRGQILRGLLGRYSPWTAIAVSAVIFSVAHLNPVQFPATLLLGLLLGWLYWRTGSVWPSMFAHAWNNFLPSLAAIATKRPDEATIQMSRPIAVASLVLGLTAWLLAFAWLRRMVPAPPAPAPPPLPPEPEAGPTELPPAPPEPPPLPPESL
jgi:membrane protease YdiL (CAAX protease family)